MAVGTGNPAPNDPRPVSAFAAQDTIAKRVDAEIMAQYRYPPAAPTRVVIVQSFSGAHIFHWYPDGTTTTDVNVNWDATKDLLYDAQISSLNSITHGEPQVAVQTNVTSGVLFKDLQPGGAYQASVRARHPVSGYASAAGLSPQLTLGEENSIMRAPANMAIQASPQTGSIVVGWDAALAQYYVNQDEICRNLKEYIIYRAVTANPTTEYARAQTNHFEDTAVTLGTTYHYRVKANNTSDHASPYSLNVGAVVYSTRPLPDLNGGVADGAQVTHTPAVAYTRTMNLSGIRRIACTVQLQKNSGDTTGITIDLLIGGVNVGTVSTGNLGAYPAITKIALTTGAFTYTGSQTIQVVWSTTGVGLSMFVYLDLSGATALPS